MDDLDFVLETIEPWLDKYHRDGVEALSPTEALGVGVWLLEAEVNNGGFDQYYFNTSGVLAVSTVRSLAEIGAKLTSSLLAAANADVPNLPLPDDRDLRGALLDEVAETARFKDLEAEFYECNENRIALLAIYLKKSKIDT